MDAAVIRRHRGDPVFDDDPTDQPRGTTLQHLGNGALAPAAAVDADHAGEHLVAVHHRAHLLRREVQVVAALVGAQKAVALSVGQHHARNQVELLRRRVAAAATQQQLAVAHHRRKALAQRFQIDLVVDAQRFGNARLGQQFAAFFEQGQNRLPAWNRAIVALRLTVGVRIAAGARGRLGTLSRRRSGARSATGGPGSGFYRTGLLSVTGRVIAGRAGAGLGRCFSSH